MQIEVNKILQAYKNKGYKLFENDSKEYNLNIFGVRSNDKTPDVFNDVVGLLWNYGGNWCMKIYKATTDPGLYYLLKPMNVKGTAILVPGQYLGVYKVGLHTGYKALQQIKPMKYYRDNDKDKEFDTNTNTIVEEIAATNIHHAGKDSIVVSNWSAGCQVIAKLDEWNDFISICDKASKIHGNSFSYTLFDENDI